MLVPMQANTIALQDEPQEENDEADLGDCYLSDCADVYDCGGTTGEVCELMYCANCGDDGGEGYCYCYYE